MKISEQSKVMADQNIQKKPIENLNFGHWINNPTKNTSGDEYYWQHQEQLQQSALQFNSLSATKKQEQQGNTNTEEHPVRASESNTLTNCPIPNNTMYSPSINPKTLFIEEYTLQKISTTKEQPLTSRPIPQTRPEAPLKIKTPPQIKETTPANNRQSLPVPCKNHHLFIQDDEAELSINMNELKPAEQKKLIHLMKQTLKQKGLALSQMLINGVQND